MSAQEPVIIVVGDQTPLAYLIRRYAEHSRCRVLELPQLPSLEQISACDASAVLFPSIESLELARSGIAELASSRVAVLVCSSLADEARAHDLGADLCLTHPLTIDSFQSVLDRLEERDGSRRSAAP